MSLLLAPALAALGCFVPMISGRGLGHSGGTLDKLEAIPGLSTELDAPRLRRVVAEAGCAIVGASPDIAPADRRLYGVRDVTGTVDHVDLITASILSKKLAAGTDALVLDVKVGSGAFMRDIEAARTLATALVDTANGAGCPTHALITDMDQPLAPALGNALEVMAVMRTLAEGDTAAPLAQLAAELGGSLLVSASLADTPREGAVMVADVLRGGQAAERFAMMVRAMGGPGDFVERWRDRLPAAPEIRAVTAEHAGVVTAIDGRALGEAVVRMGGGRQDLGDVIDPAVGLSDVMRLGEPVDAGSVLARVHAGRPVAAEAAEAAVRAAFTVAESAPAERSRVLERPLVLERIG